NGRAQHVHGKGSARELPQKGENSRIQLARLCQRPPQLFEFATGRQLAVPQEVADLFEGGILGQVMDINATVGQDAPVSIYVADAGDGGDNAFQTLGRQSGRRHKASHSTDAGGRRKVSAMGRAHSNPTLLTPAAARKW